MKFLIVLSLACFANAMPQLASYGNGGLSAQASSQSLSIATPPPVAILSSHFNPLTADSNGFDFGFEAENGIKQSASGQVNGESVQMKGSYEYLGADGQLYQVTWYADETGFHPSAPHLPQPVEIPFPEQKAAVEAQIKFAAEEEAQALKASASNPVASIQPLPISAQPTTFAQPAAFPQQAPFAQSAQSNYGFSG